MMMELSLFLGRIENPIQLQSCLGNKRDTWCIVVLFVHFGPIPVTEARKTKKTKKKQENKKKQKNKKTQKQNVRPQGSKIAAFMGLAILFFLLVFFVFLVSWVLQSCFFGFMALVILVCGFHR